MTGRKDLAASVRQRLLNKAQSMGIDANFLWMRFSPQNGCCIGLNGAQSEALGVIARLISEQRTPVVVGTGYVEKHL